MAEAHKRAYRHPKYKTSYRSRTGRSMSNLFETEEILLSGSAGTQSTRRQHRFEDLRPGRMAFQKTWGKTAQTLEKTPPWRR